MKKIVGLMMAASLTAGCATYDPYTGEKKTSSATKGATVGAVAGAIVGAATSSKGDRTKGVLTGAVAGAAVGGGIGYYMDKQEAELRRELEGTGVGVERVGDEIKLIMPGNITFDTNSASVKSNFYPVLDSVTKVFQKYEKTTINVAGFTDSTGTDAINQRLSEERARSVSQYFINRGVNAGRIHAQGFGSRYPVASNQTAAGRAANRRVEISLTGTE